MGEKSLWGSDLIPRQSYSNWLFGTPLQIEISLIDTDIRVWVSNYIHMKQWGVITRILPDANDDLVKPPLQLGYGWVIQSTWNHINMYPHSELNWYLLSKGIPVGVSIRKADQLYLGAVVWHDMEQFNPLSCLGIYISQYANSATYDFHFIV